MKLLTFAEVRQYLAKRSILNKTNGCIEWLLAPDKFGYGHCRLDRFPNSSGGTNWITQRLSYTVHVGDIPEYHGVLHTCDNPLCINPKHLFTGSHKDNMVDKTNKGRAKGGRPAKVASC